MPDEAKGTDYTQIIRKIESKTALTQKARAAYARVSTEAEEQQESCGRGNYYGDLHPPESHVGVRSVYADPGRKRTGAANRPEFQKMIGRRQTGKLESSSSSPFPACRNVVDAQKYVTS